MEWNKLKKPEEAEACNFLKKESLLLEFSQDFTKFFYQIPPGNCFWLFWYNLVNSC